jgi:hypothetical protein
MGSQAGIVAFLVVGEQGVEAINIPFGARAPLNNTVMLRDFRLPHSRSHSPRHYQWNS